MHTPYDLLAIRGTAESLAYNNPICSIQLLEEGLTSTRLGTCRDFTRPTTCVVSTILLCRGDARIRYDRVSQTVNPYLLLAM